MILLNCVSNLTIVFGFGSLLLSVAASKEHGTKARKSPTGLYFLLTIHAFLAIWVSLPAKLFIGPFKVELQEGPLDQFTDEMEPFLHKQGMPVRLNKIL
ncbi:hypothetical protein LOK49_LG01G01390 [Camellia lanceoleosa]|uniref:Uncharacterized protein n=1 Tax=Camellia lanceoleosa TaxID=1840588 RepID=A0ACC0J600_9ERIC|nr:hypothetical protein LOK49_LG01G01390 [Camellia lanceoleosa]